MKKLLFSILVLSITTAISAQEILLNETPDDSLNISKNIKGTSFGTVFGIGVPLGDGAGPNGQVKTWNSSIFNFNIYYQNRFSNIVGYTAYLRYTNENYRIDQNIYDTEKVITNSFGVGLGLKLFAGTGKHYKKYLELGGYADFVTGSRVHRIDESLFTGVLNADKVEIIQHKPSIVNNFNYGPLCKIGFKNFAIYGRYRLSELFSPNVFYDEFTPLVVGINFGI